MRIDVHSHFQSVEFVRHLVGRSGLPSAVQEEGTYIVDCGAGLRVPSLPEIIDAEAELEAIDRLGIDVSVLTHGLPLGPDVLGAEADDWAMRINDELARIVQAYPGKFIGFGSLGLSIRSGRSRKSTAASPSSGSAAFSCSQTWPTSMPARSGQF